MFSRVLYLLCSLLAVTSALNPTQVESFFYIVAGSTINQPLIQTTNNTIAYSVEKINLNTTLTPQYLSINLTAGDARLIIVDIMDACGQNNATYSRIYYHTSQSTLVYYCTRNNTLLILDENDYTVKDTIATQVVGEFNETKITAEGESVVILGTGTPFTTNYTDAQLVKINLSTKQVTRLVVFNTGLAEGEILTSYASTGVLSFVLTNQANISSSTTTVTIYSVIFVGNNYKLTRLSSFSYALMIPPRTNELYCIGDYLVTNSYQDLLFINVQGGVSERFTDLFFFTETTLANTNPLHGGRPEYFEVPNYAMQHGSSDLYAHFLNKSVLHITSNGLVVTSNLISQAEEVHIAVGNQDSRDLLYAVADLNMTVLVAKTGSPIYDAPNFYTELYLANTSYVAIDFGYVILDRKTNNFTGTFPAINAFFQSYFEETNQVFYYIDFDLSNLSTTHCTVKYVQPDTVAEGEILSFDASDGCFFNTFVYVKAGGDIATPDFVLAVGVEFLIYSKEYGQISYTPQDYAQVIVPNFDDMSIYEVSADEDISISVSKYTYNGTSFNLQTSYNLNIPSGNGDLAYLVIDSETLAIYYGEEFVVIDLTKGTLQSFNVPLNIHQITNFQDDSDQNYLIIANQSLYSGLVAPRPYIYGPNLPPTPLPGSDEYTMFAGAAGHCTYWVEQGYISSFGVAKFYDVCSENRYDSYEYENGVDFSIIS